METTLSGLRAAAEATRLRALLLCARGELTVSELTDILGQSQPRVSRHLKLLCEAGLLDRFREGTWVFYRLAERGRGAELAPADKKFRPWERLALYNVQNATSLAEFSGTIGQCDADLSPDGRWLVAPTPNLVTFKIYDVETRQPIAVARDFPWGWGGPPVDRVRFDPDGKYLVVASRKAGRSAVYQIGL